MARHLPTQDCLEQIARETPDLNLLLVFGSRSRGDDWEGSDWDFGYLAGPAFDPDDLLARLVLALGDDRIDLVDLSRASGLLRYRAAADGRPLFESREHAFEDFWFEAASFWCDVQPVVQDAYEGVLERLSP